VLVGERETCKVTDFGMARDVQQDNIYERKTKAIDKMKGQVPEICLFKNIRLRSPFEQIKNNLTAAQVLGLLYCVYCCLTISIIFPAKIL